MTTIIIIILAVCAFALLACGVRLLYLYRQFINEKKAFREETHRPYYELQGSGHCDTCPWHEETCKKIYTTDNKTICVI